MTLAVLGGAGTSPAQEASDAVPHAQRLATEGQAALAGEPPDLVLAEARFAEVVAGKTSWYHPWAWTGLSTVARLRGRPWEGVGHLRAAFRLLEKWRADPEYRDYRLVRRSFRTALGERVRVHLALGLPDLAEVDARAFLACSEDVEDRARATLFAIDAALAGGDYELAEIRARSALGDEQLVGALADRRVDLEARAAIAGRRQRPLEEQWQVAQQLERLLGEGLPPHLHWRCGLEAVDAWLDAGEAERAADLALKIDPHTLSDAKHAGEALAQRARVVIARGADRQALLTARAELAAAAETWFSQLAHMPERAGGVGLFQFLARRDLLATLLRLDLMVLDSEAGVAAAFDHLESALAMGMLSRRFAAPRAQLADVRALLPPGGGALMLCVGSHSATMLAIDGVGQDAHTTPVDRALRGDLRALAREIDEVPDEGRRSHAGVSAFRQRAAAVRDRLFSPALRERIDGWSQVVVVGFEDNGQVLQALPWGDTWLGLAKPLIFLPSMTLGTALRDRRAGPAGANANAGSRLVLIGDPPVDADFGARWGVDALALDARRREAIGGAFGPAERVDAWGPDARASVLATPAARGADAWCFFTHGVQDLAVERSAAIVLAGETGTELLFADGVERLRAPPLVLLGVCDAADGPDRIGDDGAGHLGGAFIRAGAQCVVLAHGALSVGATEDLLAACLTEWRQGAGIAEAMRAGRELVAGRRGREHPHHFAGLRVVGIDPGPPRSTRSVR